MAVAHVTSSQSHASGSFSVSQTSFSWTHTTTTDPQGVLVLVFQGVAFASAVTSVTYGGTNVPQVSGGAAFDTATEPGAVIAFYLGSGVPTADNPTVVVNRTNNTTSMWAVATTVTAATDTEVTGIVLTQENAAVAEQSVNDGSLGSNSMRYAGVYYGGATPAPAGGNSTQLFANDAGAYGWTAVRETTAGQGARLVGCTQATADDLAGVHLAVREAAAPTNWTQTPTDTEGLTDSATVASPRYIAGVSPAGTHFVDQAGDPRLLVGEDNWSLLANGGAWGTYTTVWESYFASRQAQGYNTVEVSWSSFSNPNVAFVHADGSDWDATWPFATTMDPTTSAVSTFWTRRDQFFAMAASHGFTVVCNISTPSLDLTPAPAQKTWTTAQWQAFGTFIGTRYKDTPNILWIVGDDYFGGVDAGMTAMLTNMRTAGDTHPISIQLYQEGTSRQDLSTLTKDPLDFSKRAQYEWTYTYNVTYDGIEKGQNYTPTVADDVQHQVPTVWGDGFYLASGTSGSTDVRLERQMIWWALSTGACGFTTGDNEIWPWASTSAGFVTSKSFYNTVIPAIASAFSALPNWHLLAPDTSNALVTAGRGTKLGPITSGGGGTPYIGNTDNYVTASRTPDIGSGSSLAVIYCAKAFSITIDQSKMGSGYTVTWIDPVSGATSSGTPGSTYNSATAKGNNSAGDPDWVLVLQAPVSGDTSLTPADNLGLTDSVTVVTPPPRVVRSASIRIGG